jgi:hypothetical protein
MDINQNSGQVEIIGEFGSVFLYTHDLAHDLLHAVYDVLSKRQRWDDPDYFSRMLFCRMVPCELWNKTDGFGIGTQMYADVKFLIAINLKTKRLTINNWNESGSVCRAIHYDFENFINNFASNASL